MQYKLITERTHYYSPAIHIVMVVEIGGSPTYEEVTSAVNKAVARHDILNSRVLQNEEGDAFFSLVESRKVPVEFRETSSDSAWRDIIREQERIPFDFEKGELIRLFLIKNCLKTSLILVAHHLAGDGKSMIYFIRDIMEALGNPSITFEELPVQPLYTEAFPNDVKLNPMISFMTKQLNRTWKKHKKVFSYQEYLAMFHSFWQDRQVELLKATISGVELTKLLNACKEREITVNSAIVTAFMLNMKEEDEVGLAVSVRPKEFEGMANYASGISIAYQTERKKTFWNNAEVVQNLIYQKLENNSKRYFVLKFLNLLEPTLVDAVYFSAYAGYENKTAGRVRDLCGYSGDYKGISITNLTKVKIPEKYGAYHLKNIEFIPPMVPNAIRVIGVITVQDTMTITMQYVKKDSTIEWKNAFYDAIKMMKAL